jgi:hypothetical protein
VIAKVGDPDFEAKIDAVIGEKLQNNR